MIHHPYGSDTLVGLLEARAADREAFPLYVFEADGGGEAIVCTCGELARRSRILAGFLQDRLKPGDRALLLYPSGSEFVQGFFGCLLAGVIAIPVYPPEINRLQRSLPRLESIVRDASPALALSSSTVMSKLGIVAGSTAGPSSLGGIGTIPWFVGDRLENGWGDRWKDPSVRGETLAFLQYTSGSTRAPRGVMVSHANLMHNLSLIQSGMEMNSDCCGVNWLPIFHDMGLIGGILEPLYAGITTTQMSPMAFLQSPMRWLRAIAKYGDRPVISGGPNFAYDLCVQWTSDAAVASLSLHNWTVAFSGAEPVRAATLDRFTKAFATCGFRRQAFYPCYGLAEGTLFVTGSAPGFGPVVTHVDRDALRLHHWNPVPPTDQKAQALVSCGHVPEGQQVVIVNPELRVACAEGDAGEVWVRGPSVARGYWNQPEETASTFGAALAGSTDAQFMRTGDMGVLVAGELYITGRRKDLIIIRGQNHYPQDIEQTVEASHTALRPNSGAAISIDRDGDERLVIVQEVKPSPGINLSEVSESIVGAVADHHDLQVDTVVLVRRGTIPKTSSGKIQRQACKKGFLEGTLEIVKEFRPVPPLPAQTVPERVMQAPAVRSTEPASTSVSPGVSEAEIESRLVARIAAILKSAPALIDVKKPFTSYGLDSAQVVGLSGELSEWLGRPLPATLAWTYPTIRELAAYLGSAPKGAIAAEPAFPPDRGTSDGSGATHETETRVPSEWPLSYGQRAMWFQYTMNPRSIFNPTYAARVKAPLDITKLRRCFQTVVNRHPMLRTTFHRRGERIVQLIHASEEVAFRHEDMPGRSYEDLQGRLNQEARYLYDLENGPLFRVLVFTLGENDHILLMGAHHIVVDMWSQAIIANEVSRLYATGGEEPGSLLRRSGYTDFVLWQERFIRGSEGGRHWDYWKERLAGELPVLTLPADRPRPAVQAFEGRTLTAWLDEDVSAAITRVSEQQGMTLYMTLLAAFNVLLHRYTGQKDIIVGTPATGRSRPEWDDVVGYFVNPVAVRSDLSGDPPFARLLEKTRENVVGVLEYQDFPFSVLVERLRPRRDPSRTPVFPVMFVYQRAHLLDEEGLSGFALGSEGTQLRLGGMSLESLPLESGVAPFDLTLMMARRGDRLGLSLSYATALYEAPTIQRMLAHFSRLLKSIAGDPEARLSRLALMSREESERIVSGWNRTGALAEPEETILQAFTRAATAHAEKPALLFGGRELTYAELESRSNQLARYLRTMGASPETLVGVCLDRSPEMVVALLGILKTGAAYLPLDPEHPAERRAYVLGDARARLLLTVDSLTKKTGPFPGATICLDRARSVIAEEGVDPLESVALPDNLAYAIYTSGSTGKPKGVLLTHRGLFNLVRAQVKAFEITAASRVLQFASIGFDASVSEIFTSLLSGATLCLVERDMLLSGPALLQELRCRRITTVTLPPSMLSVLPGEELPDLRTVISAGESCAPDVAHRWSVNRRFLNAYGPTESTVCATCFMMNEPINGASVPIGVPIDNVQVYILDEHLNPVPAGIPGELHIAGIGLARGYQNRPDLTADRFVPNPFSAVPGGRLYRSGDIASYLPDGTIQFIGRLDDQVKVRGFRVELQEIDVALRGLPWVQDAVTVFEPREQRLVAYYALKINGSSGQEDSASPEISPQGTKNALRNFLPGYMVPAILHRLDRIPLTPHGKIDRKALPDPRTISAVGSALPATDLEHRIAGLWQEVLGITRVGINDNFFDLGGHSLNLIQLQMRLKEHFNRDMTVIDMFRYPTVSALAQFLSHDQDERSTTAHTSQRAILQRQALVMQAERARTRRQT